MNVVWDVAAVSTLSSHRRQGYAKRVVSFIAQYILDEGKTAVIAVRNDNAAMIATAKSVGFQELPEEKVWWSYPE